MTSLLLIRVATMHLIKKNHLTIERTNYYSFLFMIVYPRFNMFFTIFEQGELGDFMEKEKQFNYLIYFSFDINIPMHYKSKFVESDCN